MSGTKIIYIHFSSVQLLSHVQLFATPWTVAHQASLSITNSQSLLKLKSIKSVMPSNHLILYCPLLLLPSIFSSIRVFSKESILCIRWPKYWSFSFSISSSNEYSGLISFSIDWFDLLAVQGTVKSLIQHHSSKASILSAFFMIQLSHSYMMWSEMKSKSLSCVRLFVTPWTIQSILQVRILERVAYPSSSRSSQPRNQTGVSCIAGGFFTSWAIREAMILGVYFFLFWKILGRRDQPELGMLHHILYKNKFELSTVFCILYFCYDFLFIKVFNSELSCFYSTVLYLSGRTNKDTFRKFQEKNWDWGKQGWHFQRIITRILLTT